MSLPISDIISVSVSTPPSGASEFRVNNLAIFTKETPVNGSITASNPGVYVSPAAVLADWGTGSEAYDQANAIFSQTPNILSGNGLLYIFPMASGDTLNAVVPTALAKASFYGMTVAGYAPTDTEVMDTAAVVEPLRVKFAVSSSSTDSLTPTTGLFARVKAASYKHTRCLLYTVSAKAGRIATAALLGRGMSVDFSGTNTTNTLHLKTLVGVDPDPAITEAIKTSCATQGVDFYTIIGGAARYWSNGANEFFDNVYNLDWFVFALQVAGFNALAETGTKLPQTETGMAVLRGAYLNVLKQAVVNGYVAPGVWNSSEMFGNPDDFKRNISDNGYFLYSQPVNDQSQSDRAARKAPLIQIAIKLAGAIQSSSVIVSINV